MNSNINAYRYLNRFFLQRQNQRINIAPVDEEIIGLARNLAFPTFQKPQEDKVGIYSSISDIRVGRDKSVLDRNFRKI